MLYARRKNDPDRCFTEETSDRAVGGVFSTCAWLSQETDHLQTGSQQLLVGALLHRRQDRSTQHQDREQERGVPIRQAVLRRHQPAACARSVSHHQIAFRHVRGCHAGIDESATGTRRDNKTDLRDYRLSPTKKRLAVFR